MIPNPDPKRQPAWVYDDAALGRVIRDAVNADPALRDQMEREVAGYLARRQEQRERPGLRRSAVGAALVIARWVGVGALLYAIAVGILMLATGIRP